MNVCDWFTTLLDGSESTVEIAPLPEQTALATGRIYPARRTDFDTLHDTGNGSGNPG